MIHFVFPQLLGNKRMMTSLICIKMMTDLNVWHFECRALYLNLPFLISSYFCFGLIRSTLKGGWLSLTKLHRKCFIFFKCARNYNFLFVCEEPKYWTFTVVVFFFHSLSIFCHRIREYKIKNLYTYKWKMIAPHWAHVYVWQMTYLSTWHSLFVPTAHNMNLLFVSNCSRALVRRFRMEFNANYFCKLDRNVHRLRVFVYIVWVFCFFLSLSLSLSCSVFRYFCCYNILFYFFCMSF